MGETVTLTWTVSNSGGFLCILVIDVGNDGTTGTTDPRESVTCASGSFDHTPTEAVEHLYNFQVVQGSSVTRSAEEIVAVAPDPGPSTCSFNDVATLFNDCVFGN